ncbi:MAG TPA: ATP-binding protein, partial [Terriglobales bacterium]|nr:ATP-binding protein [Terriglobales bacterium]
METSSQPAHGANPPATPESADHLAIRAGEWRTVFYSFAVLNLVTIAVSFWFMVRVAELDDPLVHAAALQKFEYSIAALGLLVVGSILRGFQLGRQSETDLSQHRVARALYAASQQDLELTVSARTRELANANDFLLAEIAERERAERRLRQTEERFQLLSQATHDCVWDWDLEKDTLWFNDAMRELLGHSDSNTGNMEWWAGNLHASDRERVMQGLQQAIAGGRRLWADEFRFRRGDGAYAYVLNRGYVVRNDDGHALRLISAMTDLSQRRRAEEELRQAKEAAESANRAKSEFVANVSHEIRTPMNGVLGMLELALGTELTPEQREYLKLARNSADALLRVINGILDFSKIEAGHLQLETISFSLRSTLEDIAGAFALEAVSKGLELNCEVASEIPDKLLGDPGRLRQILINLMGNSLKFTERGHVTVRVAEEAGSESALRSGNQNEVRLQFAVSDSGIGVAPEKQQLIFEAFKQADGSTTRRYGGTGLGLAISRQLVELMAGRIWLESSPAVGSIFRFTAAFRVAEAPAAALPQPTDLRGMRALVVEDQAGRHEALDALQRWGMLPTLVRGTAEALAALRQASERSIPFPLVVMDLHMPEVEGFRLVERIQQETQFA